MLFDDDKITDRWVEYVNELYDDVRNDMPDIDHDEGCDIIISETKVAVRNLNNGKSSGIDKITFVVIKALDQKGLKRIHVLCNTIYNRGYIP